MHFPCLCGQLAQTRRKSLTFNASILTIVRVFVKKEVLCCSWKELHETKFMKCSFCAGTKIVKLKNKR